MSFASDLATQLVPLEPAATYHERHRDACARIQTTLLAFGGQLIADNAKLHEDLAEQAIQLEAHHA
jgi:alkylation response protein AidB-like acyl-CoA dehydrogenase